MLKLILDSCLNPFAFFFTNVLVILFVIVSAEHRVSVTLKRSFFLVLTVAKNVNFKLSGEDFFMISITKIMVPL